MRSARLGFLSAVVVSASLALSTAAWSRPDRPAPVHAVRSSGAGLRATNGRRDDLLGWIMAWWNDGSCHGYPDVMEVYVLYGDAETNTITSWYDDGETGGTDSCSDGHESTWDTGLHVYDGYVQGYYLASTIWTPDDGICDGCLSKQPPRDGVLGANWLLAASKPSVVAQRVAPWQKPIVHFLVPGVRATAVVVK